MKVRITVEVEKLAAADQSKSYDTWIDIYSQTIEAENDKEIIQAVIKAANGFTNPTQKEPQ